MPQIVIKKAYFDNIKVAVDAMNKFFASGMKTKAFPVINDDFQLDRIVARTLSWLNNIEPSWIDNPQIAVDSLNKLKAFIAGEGPAEEPVKEADESELPTPTLTDPNSPWKKIFSSEDQVATDMFHAFIGFKMLQYIAQNFNQFDQLMNGVYTFELFTQPSKYREAITTFTKGIPLPELNQVAPFPGEYKLFDPEEYVGSIFSNDQIKLPKEMDQTTEVQRFNSFTDLADAEIVVDETVTEAAETNYFDNFKPMHIKYEPKSGTWKISKELEKSINKFLDTLRKCDSVEDLAGMLQQNPIDELDMFLVNVIPAILVRVVNSTKKYPFDMHDVDAASRYSKSYTSIVKQNAGAVRFERIDLFSTFKSDKEGTLEFLEDFMKLKLVNDPNAVITNNTLLTVFNIFDSRIYFDILFNAADGDVKGYDSEDGFVKAIRGRINKNSRSANPYQKEKKIDNTIMGSDQVTEEAYRTVRDLGEMSHIERMYSEEFIGAVYDEIDTLGDALYNVGTSAIMIDRYIGESHNLFQEGVLKSMRDKSTKKKIIRIERALNAHLPELFVDFINHPPGKRENPKYHNGTGILGIVFSFSDMASAVSSMGDISELMKKNKVLMFAEWYDCDTMNAEFDEDLIKCLWLNLNDGSIMISANPFNLDTFFMSDLKHFENSLEDLLNNLDDWEGKPLTKNELDNVPDSDDEEEPESTESEIDADPDEDDEDDAVQEFMSDDYDDKKKKPAKYVDKKKGHIPDYLRDRMGLNEDETEQDEDKKKDTTVTDVELPPDLANDPPPENDIDDLADSVNARTNAPGAEGLDDMLGAGYKGPIGNQGGQGHVVYNITNNYTNSHNTTTVTTDDHSSGKTTNTTTTSNDLSSNKRTNTAARTPVSNNKDNTRPSSNSKDSSDFSTGKSVQEVFALLRSEEPLFVESDAGKPPKGDLLTASMDADRTTLSAHQKVKRGAEKVMNTGKQLVKPITRAKSWMKNMVDSIIKRDENQVKAEMIENSSYRSAVYKVARIALKAGKFAIFNAISPYLGLGYLGVQALKIADKDRLRREVNQELATEIQIVDQKIKDLKNRSDYGHSDPASQQELYKLMRIRQQLVNATTDAHKRTFASPSSVY